MSERARYYRLVRRQGWNRGAARTMATMLPAWDIARRVRLFELAGRA